MRIAAVCLVVAIASAPAYAQGGRPPGTGESIQSLAERLDALTARVGKLESGQFVASDIVGTYGWAYMGIELLGNPGRVSNESITASLEFKSDGTIEFSGTADDCLLQQGTPWAVTCAPQEGGNAVPVGTWRVQDGTLLVAFDGDDEEAVFAGSNGRIIVFGGMVTYEYAPGQRLAFSNIAVLIKLPSQ